MRKLLNFAVLALLASAARGAESKWIRMPLADLEIYSNTGERDTRRVLQYFERVRSFFQQAAKLRSDSNSEPLHVIVFSSKKEYAQYRPSEAADAFYTQIAGRDYIVLGGADDSVFPIAAHEYVHYVAGQGGLKLPPWLGEGLAELFSTLEPEGDKVLVGKPVQARERALLHENWVPLATIVAATHDSAIYNERSKAGSLYNEGWALTHMLDLSPEYSPRFAAFLDEIQKGTPSRQALEQIYGKPLASFDRDLQKYLRSSMFVGKLFPLKIEKAENVAAEPAPMFDVKLALVALGSARQKEAEVRKGLDELIHDDPSRPEPHVLLGYLAWRAGQQDQALTSFQKAIELGGRNAEMLWAYGRMASKTDASQAMLALNLLLTDEPWRTDVRLALAQIQVSAKRPLQAIATLSSMKSVTPEDAPRLFQILAYADLERGNRPASRINAQRWLDHTQDTAGKADANRLLHYLDEQDAAAARPGSPATTPAPVLSALDQDDTDPIPKLARTEPPPPDREPDSALPSISGKLVELDCGDAHPKLVLETENGRVSFVMDDPQEVRVTGLRNGTIDMKCGPQKQVGVRIEYDSPAEATPGVTGIARAIHYEEAGKR